MKGKLTRIAIASALVIAFALPTSSVIVAMAASKSHGSNSNESNGNENEHGVSIGANVRTSVSANSNSITVSDDEDTNATDTEDGSGECPGFVPPGHLIAPGWLKHHGDEEPTVPDCEDLPPGIGMRFGTSTHNGDHEHQFTLSSVSASAATSTATITWNTNKPASSQVFYGLTAAHGSSTSVDSALVTSHSEMLSGLTPNTTYHFQVKSADADGDVVISADATFTTAALPADTIPPTVSITSPLSSTTVSSTITVSATSTDNVGVANVQFLLDGANLGSAVTSTPYSILWDTKTATNGAHTLTAIAHDTSSNVATSSAISVIVDNGAPVISSTTAAAVTSTVTISWMTDEPANSQVFYGLTTAYGSTTPIDATLVTSHSVTIAGLTPGTLYHFEVLSMDGVGNLATSSDNSFSTAALPAILSATSTAATSTATVSWTTNVSTTGTVYYSTSTPVNASTSASVSDASSTTAHAVALTGLNSSSTYFFVVKATDSFGDTITSSEGSFTTGP